MLKAKMPGEKLVLDQVKTPYNYTEASLPLPLPHNFISIFSSRLTKKEAAQSGNPLSLVPLYENFLNRHFAIGLSPKTLMPALHKEDLIASLLNMADWQLVWISPVDDPELLKIAHSKEHIRFIHSKEENGWKLSPDQLESWCRENSQILSKTILYLPKPISDNVWKVGEFKHLCDVARKHGVYFLREEFGSTDSQESLLHFYPEKSFVFFNPLSGTNGAGWGLGCLILPQNGAWNSIWEQMNNQENKSLISGLEISALHTYLETFNEIRALHVRWEQILGVLRKEVYELLSVSQLKFKKSQTGNSIFLDFDMYRSKFGRRGAYNSSDLCKRIFQDSKVKLVPGSDLGCPPGTLVAAMFLTNLQDFDWFLGLEDAHVDTSFLYKQCWNCIDGAQKLMRYLNSLD